MSATEKDVAITRFRRAESHILVSTTV
ncbi:MAG: hypothetical protein EBZ36_13485, partial [Acidobacteria bacterium]|nr:hypothetical protein [Acidobacteriota bacterium]